MWIFAVVDSFVDDHIPIYVLMYFMAFSQLMSRLSRLPFKYIPSNLKGSVSQVTLVSLLISGESMALPKRAYFVLETLVFRPDSYLKLFSMFRTQKSHLNRRYMFNKLWHQLDCKYPTVGLPKVWHWYPKVWHWHPKAWHWIPNVWHKYIQPMAAHLNDCHCKLCVLTSSTGWDH